MAWIESHTELLDHPKTLRASRRLGCSRAATLGHLHILWWWALKYADDGDLSGFDAGEIAAGADWTGDPAVFVEALTSAGFLDSVDDRLVIHDWWDFAGRLVERRRSNAARMREKRARADTVSPDKDERAAHVQDTSSARAGATVPYQTVNAAAAVTTNSNARACEEEDEAAAVLTVLGVEPGGDDAEIVREAIRSHPDQPHLLKARECKTDDWRSLSPRRRASRYHNWLLGARRIQEEQSASRAPPGNGAPAPAADHFLPDDPDEMARIQREYEVRENRATERRNRSSLGSASRTGGAGQRPDRTGRDEPPG